MTPGTRRRRAWIRQANRTVRSLRVVRRWQSPRMPHLWGVLPTGPGLITLILKRFYYGPIAGLPTPWAVLNLFRHTALERAGAPPQGRYVGLPFRKVMTIGHVALPSTSPSSANAPDRATFRQVVQGEGDDSVGPAGFEPATDGL